MLANNPLVKNFLRKPGPFFPLCFDHAVSNPCHFTMEEWLLNVFLSLDHTALTFDVERISCTRFGSTANVFPAIRLHKPADYKRIAVIFVLHVHSVVGTCANDLFPSWFKPTNKFLSTHKTYGSGTLVHSGNDKVCAVRESYDWLCWKKEEMVVNGTEKRWSFSVKLEEIFQRVLQSETII